jgi:hypothetical protein
MGKVILEFDSVEEQDEVKTALDGYKWKLAMWDLDQKLRSITKYGVSITTPNTSATGVEQDVADKLREKIRSILNSHNLNLED